MSNGLVSYQPNSFGELETFCKRICGTGMVPQAYRNKPDDAAVAVMFGNEIGLPPMTSLQFVAVINGRPGIYGDAMPGLAMNKGLIADMQERFEGEPFLDDYAAACTVTRPNGTMVTQRFSVADAKKANLWAKAGPWTQYPRRMLQWRARSWAIRDAAPNLLFGMSAEELQDIEVSEQRGPDTARDITPKDEPVQSPRAAVAAAMEAVEAIPEEEAMLEIVKICGEDGNPFYTGSIFREAVEAYGAMKKAAKDKAAVAVKNLPALKVLKGHAEGKTFDRLRQEIEAAEANPTSAPIEEEAA